MRTVYLPTYKADPATSLQAAIGWALKTFGRSLFTDLNNASVSMKGAVSKRFV